MRVLLVLLTLVATPFVASVAQAPDGSTRPDAVIAPPSADMNCLQSGSFQTVDNLACAGPVTLGEIHGTVFQEFLGIGVRLPADPGIPSAVVLLNGVQILTDAAGNYGFTGLAAGTYLVCEVQRANWLQTLPSSVGGTLCGVKSWGYTVVLAPGQIVTGKDFGNFLLF